MTRQHTVHQAKLGLVPVFQFARDLSGQFFIDFRCDAIDAGQRRVYQVYADHFEMLGTLLSKIKFLKIIQIESTVICLLIFFLIFRTLECLVLKL